MPWVAGMICVCHCGLLIAVTDGENEEDGNEGVWVGEVAAGRQRAPVAAKLSLEGRVVPITCGRVSCDVSHRHTCVFSSVTASHWSLVICPRGSAKRLARRNAT